MQSLPINMHYFPPHTTLERAYESAVACRQMTQAPKLVYKFKARKKNTTITLYINHIMYY